MIMSEKLFIPDLCTGNVVLLYPSRRIVKAKRIMVDIGFSRVKGNSDDVDIVDYINYVVFLSHQHNADVMAIIPDSWDYNKHVMNLIRFRKVIKQRIERGGDDVKRIRWLIVVHYGNVNAFVNQYIAYYQGLKSIIPLGFAIPLRKMTVYTTKPGVIACSRRPSACDTIARYIIKKIGSVDDDAYIHGLGIRKKLLPLLNLLNSADTASYRLAINDELRTKDYGKGTYMISSKDSPCDWFSAWLGDYA
mgnify:CR=1 FL=1